MAEFGKKNESENLCSSSVVKFRIVQGFWFESNWVALFFSVVHSLPTHSLQIVLVDVVSFPLLFFFWNSTLQLQNTMECQQKYIF